MGVVVTVTAAHLMSRAMERFLRRCVSETFHDFLYARGNVSGKRIVALCHCHRGLCRQEGLVAMFACAPCGRFMRGESYHAQVIHFVIALSMCARSRRSARQEMI